ncbi:MAG: HEAT repeat domain-containing protein [Synechococcales cyanobacterium RM1_1_8]|nr:HEAT repeat domain-containing protein [Synechococcales cyanobacterium RM1_1_8]
MPNVNLAELSAKLESPNSRDRLLALVALKDAEASDALPLIKKVLQDESIQVRGMAVFALGVKRQDENYELLLQVLENDSDYSVRAAAAGAMGYLEDNRALEPLLRVFYEETDWLVRFSAAVALGNLKDSRARAALVQALQGEESVLHQAAIAALGEIGDLAALDDILRFADSDDWLVRQRLAEALGNLPSPKSHSALQYLSKDSHPQVSSTAVRSLDKQNSTDSE